MNVNVWGPPTWDVLHASAFLFDESKTNGQHFFECLKVLLPCIHCRNSYVEFFDSLGAPRKGFCAKWLYEIHEKVNKKLFNQRLEKISLFADCKALYTSPTFEVVQKRFIVNREEPFVWRSLNTMLLSFAMGLEANEDSKNIAALKKFLIYILNFINPSAAATQNNTVKELTKVLELKSAKQIREKIEELKYSKIVPRILKNSFEASNLIRAGSCINGTCY